MGDVDEYDASMGAQGKMSKEAMVMNREEDLEYDAPLTPLMVMGAIFAVFQSMNFGLGIGMVNLAAPSVEVGLDIGQWATDCNTPWATTLPDGSAVTQDTPNSKVCQTGGQENTWSWIVSVFALGAMVGALGCGDVVKRIGPKKTMLFNNITFVAASLLMAFSEGSVALMMIGRIVAGLAIGIVCGSVPLWVSECSPAKVRGALGVFHQLFVTIGIVLASILGMKSVFGNENWPWLFASMIVPAAIHMVGFFFMPESPVYLLDKGQTDAARQSLQRLRGSGHNIENELEALKREKEAQASEKTLSLGESLKTIFTRPYWHQTAIALGCQFAQQMSGINVIMFYSGSILMSAGLDDPELGTILVNVVNVLATFVAIPMIERVGRRGLLLIGFGGMSIAHALFGIGMICDWTTPTVIFMLLGVLAFAVGPGPVPWMIAAEIFPASVRGGAVSAAVFMNWLMTFAVGMFFPPLEEAMGDYTFFFFCAWTILTVLFVIFYVPETKGKTMDEVLSMFPSGRGGH